MFEPDRPTLLYNNNKDAPISDRTASELLWECNTLHRYGVEGEIRNIKPTVSPDVRNPAQANRRLVKSTEQNMGRDLWEWFVSQYNQKHRNCEVVEPAICEPYTRISHWAWACNQVSVWRLTAANDVAIWWQMQQGRGKNNRKWNLWANIVPMSLNAKQTVSREYWGCKIHMKREPWDLSQMMGNRTAPTCRNRNG